MTTALITVIGNKLPTAFFTVIFLLLVASFAILFQIERRAIGTSYLFVTHITLDDFPSLLSISINSETPPYFCIITGFFYFYKYLHKYQEVSKLAIKKLVESSNLIDINEGVYQAIEKTSR